MLFDRCAHVPVTNYRYDENHTTNDNHHNCNNFDLTDSEI